MVNWNWAKKITQKIISKNGVELEWLQRTTSGSEAYDTTSTTTYGYGDYAVYWQTGSFKAIVSPIRAEDVVIEAGFYSSDHQKIFVDPDTNLEHWQQCIYPSGSGVRYLILPVQYYIVGGVTGSKFAIIRKLVPRSGSQY